MIRRVSDILCHILHIINLLLNQIQELMKKKADEEKQRDENIKMEKKAKELELAKMRKAQQSRTDEIEKREADRATRIQTQVT